MSGKLYLMSLLSRFLWLSLIFQILAVSSIPPAFAEGAYSKGGDDIQVSLSDDAGMPGQFGGFVKNEQAFLSEDETEDAPEFHDVLHNKVKDVLQNIGITSSTVFQDTNVRFDSDIALFILFHCWKINFLIG
jgi:hypothetical protein